MEVHEPNDQFMMSNIMLTQPISLSSGVNFMTFVVNNSSLYIQPPKCKTRKGIMKGGKKMHSDLMFTNENIEFIRWIENLETYCQSYIHKNNTVWFQSDFELHDKEDLFTSSLKVFKSGKYYILRTIIPVCLGKCSLTLFDESEMTVSADCLKDETDVLVILEFKGIRCSARDFHIEIEVKQMMIMKPVQLFANCVIRPPQKITNTTADTQLITKEKEKEKLMADDEKKAEEEEGNIDEMVMEIDLDEAEIKSDSEMEFELKS
jgi:hypothetical protein